MPPARSVPVTVALPVTSKSPLISTSPAMSMLVAVMLTLPAVNSTKVVPSLVCSTNPAPCQRNGGIGVAKTGNSNGVLDFHNVIGRRRTGAQRLFERCDIPFGKQQQNGIAGYQREMNGVAAAGRIDNRHVQDDRVGHGFQVAKFSVGVALRRYQMVNGGLHAGAAGVQRRN